MEKTEIRSLLEFQFVSNPGFSPDGRLAAYVVQHAEEEENRYKGDLYILDVDRQETYRLTTHGDAYSYVWTASGTLLFSAKREEAGQEKRGSHQCVL